MRYDLAVPCIEMSENEFHVIRFSGPPREIYIDDIPYVCPFDKQIRIKLNGRAHELAWGGPGFEVIIDGRPYELQFNQPPREIIIGTRPHSIYICGDAPDVKICGRLPYEYQQPMHNDNAEDQKTNEPQQQRILPSLMKFEVPPPVGSTKLPQPPQILNQDTKPGPMDLTNLLKQLQNKGLINLEPKPAGVQLPSNLTDIISGIIFIIIIIPARDVTNTYFSFDYKYQYHYFSNTFENILEDKKMFITFTYILYNTLTKIS